MKQGWFTIPGEKEGHRTLDEQLLGLEPLIDEVAGKSVLDLGCAEGLILRHMKQHGAGYCKGYENNWDLFRAAESLLIPADCDVAWADLNVTQSFGRIFDVVLMLAILHKLQDPAQALPKLSESASDLVVIRLPYGSEGEIAWKHGRHMTCDTRRTMNDLGFRFERDLDGPRGERVHYWRRT